MGCEFYLSPGLPGCVRVVHALMQYPGLFFFLDDGKYSVDGVRGTNGNEEACDSCYFALSCLPP